MILLGSPAATSSSTSRSRECQQRRARLQLSALQTLFMRGVIPMQRSLDTVEQHLLAQRLLDKIESARLDRRDGERNRAMAGNEDHRDPPTANIQLLLELKARHLRHLYIEQQATT